MKKMIVFTAVPAVMSGIIPLSSYSAVTETVNTGDWLINFRITEDSEAVITSVSGRGKEIVIPERLINYEVTAIDDFAFFEQENIVSAVLPDTVVSVGKYAFSGCMSLESIVIPDSVESIGDGCFMSCTALESADFGESSASVPKQCFAFCDSLSYVRISDKSAEIGGEAFLSCPSVKFLRIPESIEKIGENAMGVSYGRNKETVKYSDFRPKVRKDSAAEKYASETGFSYITEGDVNGDGIVDAGDASDVLKAYADKSTGSAVSLDEEQAFAADMNGDGVTDASDASEILAEYAEQQTKEQ